ncbi:MAG: RsmD family RNA methyltransferase [Planctomycetia bacterium]|nr:RsmD family RNA methyltransferase [Planctomycetia bacterium]
MRKNSLKKNTQTDPVGLRIIGGKFRGSKLTYAGDRRVRPMKDRVRESVFNLVHSYAAGAFVIDLFGGTGALGLEAISRGAAECLFHEQHFPTARVIAQNIQSLRLENCTKLQTGDVFLFYKKRPELPKDRPWLVFCCPPYRFFQERTKDLFDLLDFLMKEAPDGSRFVTESDTAFDWSHFDVLGPWELFKYPPAVVGIHAIEHPTSDHCAADRETS